MRYLVKNCVFVFKTKQNSHKEVAFACVIPKAWPSPLAFHTRPFGHKRPRYQVNEYLWAVTIGKSPFILEDLKTGPYNTGATHGYLSDSQKILNNTSSTMIAHPEKH